MAFGQADEEVTSGSVEADDAESAISTEIEATLDPLLPLPPLPPPLLLSTPFALGAELAACCAPSMV